MVRLAASHVAQGPLREARAAGSGCVSALEQDAQQDDAGDPDQPEGDREAVEGALDDAGTTEVGGETASEEARETAALAAVEQNEHDHRNGRDDEHDRQE